MVAQPPGGADLPLAAVMRLLGALRLLHSGKALMRKEGAPPANGPAQPPAPRLVWFGPSLVPHQWRWIPVLPLLLLAPVGVAAVPVEQP